ncbi:ImmA/IrrE family metallo-endopeptidase [Methylobacter sp.]|uniref:ImmA/IrrE family metallo-endopeptidase n=1 Tax=Methylobacter sp. TaxID=2051955 RepID=UPI003DA512DD
MNDIKVIQTEQQHRAYLEEVHTLIMKMPQSGTPESDRLELLTVLIEAYENTKYPVEPPDPIDAILFRMQEKGLKQSDLVPYFGTRSRVSEVLSRKRPLTVTMIRELANGLGISTETLIGVVTPNKHQPKENVDWSKFPIKEMVARGWVQKITGRISTENVVQDFISNIGWPLGEAAFKRTLSGEAYSPTTKYALYAWLARVVQRARENTTLIEFQEDTLSSHFLREVAQLSWSEQGPKLAVEYLEKHGIAIVIEPHLKGTMLDGAALKDLNGRPIIGLTLRHDRLDNFWFTLLHELAHLWKHIGKDEMFLDDLDASSEDRREVEANRIAREAFIPRIAWKRSEAFLSPSRENIDALSRELKIHPAIIAGRIRRETGNYQLFPDLVGNGEVRKLFLTANSSEQ